MKKIIKSLSNLFNMLFTKMLNIIVIDNEFINDEPEFLKEFWVYNGRKSCTTVYARNAEEAKSQIVSYTTNTNTSEVYAIFKRTSDIPNPSYYKS